MDRDLFREKAAKKISDPELRLDIMLSATASATFLLDFFHDTVPITEWPLEVRYAAALIATTFRGLVSDDEITVANFTDKEAYVGKGGANAVYKMSEQSQERIRRKLRQILEDMTKQFEKEDG